MSKKKGKFDLSHMVHENFVKEGQMLYFVSDPSKSCKVAKQPSGEYKVIYGGEVTTLHILAQKLLGQDPPGHASKWFRVEGGKTLYDLWQDEYAEAA